MEYQAKVEQARTYLKSISPFKPDLILSLGTGLGALAEQITDKKIIPFNEIPHFPQVAVDSHKGNLVFGLLEGHNVAALQGRVHYYEGYSTREVAFPVRVLSLLGATRIFVANASGGLKPDLKAGSLLLIDDHINFMGENPLRGPNIDSWGPRFPDLSEAYSKQLNAIALEVAKELSVAIEPGVYVAIPGPSLETPAETKFLRQCGADAVGMSTVPEVIVAKHAGLEVMGISVVANVNDPENFQPILLEDVLSMMDKAVPCFIRLLCGLLRALPVNDSG